MEMKLKITSKFKHAKTTVHVFTLLFLRICYSNTCKILRNKRAPREATVLYSFFDLIKHKPYSKEKTLQGRNFISPFQKYHRNIFLSSLQKIPLIFFCYKLFLVFSASSDRISMSLIMFIWKTI